MKDSLAKGVASRHDVQLAVLLSGRRGLPAVDGEFAVHATFELEGFLKTTMSFGLRVVIPLGVGNVRQLVILDHRPETLRAAQQRTCLPLALNDVVPNVDGLKIAAGIESEKAFLTRRGSGAGDDVVVTDLHIIENLVDPDDSTAGIVDQSVVEAGGAFGCGAAEAGYQV